MSQETIDKNVLKCVPKGTPVEEVMQIIEEDGGVIIMNLFSEDQIARMNNEIEPIMEASAPGNAGGNEHMVEFTGRKTKRVCQMVNRSKTFREEVLTDEVFHSYVEGMLLPNADSYWMSTAQVIELQPGQKAQVLHRDIENYALLNKQGKDLPEVLVNCLVAMSQYTEEMGATRVIPGSHKWDDFTTRNHDEKCHPIILEPGWGVLYSGKLMHSGGENRSSLPRRAMAMVYNLGWLMPEEAHPLIIPMELAKTLDPKVQQMLGFRSFHDASNQGSSAWQVDYVELGDYLGLNS